MPYKKIDKHSNRDDTFYAIGKLYDIVISKRVLYRDEAINELELTEYGFEIAIKTLRSLITVEYPYGYLIFQPQKGKYVLVI